MLRDKTVVVDFDGVLHSYASGWTGPVPQDAPEPGAREFVEWLVAVGVRVVVVSTRARTRRGARAIRSWLAANGFPPVEVTDHKVNAVAYIDDRAIPYRGPQDWEDCKARVHLLADR